jgi:acetoin:2,6-dichlorophenolindophenol oxidoreductase subunit beta
MSAAVPVNDRAHGAAWNEQAAAPRSGTSYAEAIRRALHDALAEQPEVFIYGEDVGGVFGGAFKITKGLAESFPGRVINSPIAEDAIAGIAIGAALDGARPVIEFQFADFASVAFNQLVNHAGTTSWRAGRGCPLVARLPCGGTPGGGPFHSQMPEAWLAHHPGLIVVAPATVADAYGMLRAALRQDDPVMYCEHKLLYERLRDPQFDPGAGAPELGRAALRRAGHDCTIIAWSAMLHDALHAAQELADAHGITCDVLDLRCVRPFDEAACVASVSRTGRVLIASEDFPYGGVAAELCARLGESAFAWLDAPPRRLSARDTPVPYHPELWRAHRPQAAGIVAAVRELVAY